jgi:selenocysteine lyase/cysteine desulfurase
MSRAAERSSSSDIAFADFLRSFPAYSSTLSLDELRAREYARLDRRGQVYLDYTGGGQYAESQLRTHFMRLGDGVFGNPHSTNPASSAATERVEEARRRALGFFGASAEEYLLVFTPNATGALKLVGESYPFEPGGRLLLSTDNHNSVNGIREFARARGAEAAYAPLLSPELRLDRPALAREFGRGRTDLPRLFAFPAQSNFTGVQHPLALIEEAHAKGWDVLLDAAAFAPTHRLHVSRWKPDFVAISFYKMFGYPTGIGCLLLRKDKVAKLRRPWFSGGTVQVASVLAGAFRRQRDSAAFEDGTLDYLNLPAVETGLEHMERAGMERIGERVRCLTGWLLARMRELRHGNGRPVFRIHGPDGLEARGGTIAFNLLAPGGGYLDIHAVEERANRAGISLRTGCFCNPGVGEVIYGLTQAEIEELFRDEELTFEDLRHRVRERHGREVGAIRVSLGLASNFSDAFRFLEFVEEFRAP